MKRWFNALVYLSLVFLVIALYKADYLRVPHVDSAAALALSFVLLFGGFLADAISWRHLVRRSGYKVTRGECLAAVGLSTFGKYIPGKIWTIVGRAAYVSDRHGAPVTALSSVSLTWQFLMLWLGLLFGALGLFLVGGMSLWWWPVLLLWLFLSVLTFTNIAQHTTRHLVKRLLKRDVAVPRFQLGQTLLSLPWFVAALALLSIAFYYFVVAILPHDVPASVGLGFPFTIVLGTMAVFAPGGVGIREGLMAGYLKLAGISVEDALTVSVAARLWYLIGEAFIFAVGVFADRVLNPRPPQ